MEKTLDYNHGPSKNISIEWPNTTHQYCSISFNYFNNTTEAFSLNGPWSIFQLLNKTEVIKTNGPDSNIFEIHLKSGLAKIKIESSKDTDLLSLDPIKNFKIPFSIKGGNYE